MKFRLSHLVLLIALPSIVFAGTYATFAKEVRYVPAIEAEPVISRQSHSYGLVWNDAVGKFEAQAMTRGEPLILDQQLDTPSRAPKVNVRELAI